MITVLALALFATATIVIGHVLIGDLLPALPRLAALMQSERPTPAAAAPRRAGRPAARIVAMARPRPRFSLAA